MKRCFKIFFSKYEECQWLNKMGVKGYHLEKISQNYYYFNCEKGNIYSYSIEHLDASAKSEYAIKHFEERRALGEERLFRKGRWDYFCSKSKKINLTPEARTKISNLYFWRSLYLFFFAFVSALLCGYQKFALIILKTFGHKGDGQFDLLTIKGEPFWDKLRLFWNGVLKFFNNTYFKIFTSIFGENSVALVMAFAIPAAIILTVLFAINLDEYIFWRFSKAVKTSNSKKTIKGKK